MSQIRRIVIPLGLLTKNFRSDGAESQSTELEAGLRTNTICEKLYSSPRWHTQGKGRKYREHVNPLMRVRIYLPRCIARNEIQICHRMGRLTLEHVRLYNISCFFYVSNEC